MKISESTTRERAKTRDKNALQDHVLFKRATPAYDFIAAFRAFPDENDCVLNFRRKTYLELWNLFDHDRSFNENAFCANLIVYLCINEAEKASEGFLRTRCSETQRVHFIPRSTK